jgi:diguanylate cyclase (GGDEF)-like protein/PAS domain S-box-containing protein
VSTRNPARSPRTRGSRRLPFAAVLVGSIGIALATSFSIAALRGAADAGRRAQTLVANLEATVYERSALELEALSGEGLSPEQGERLQAARNRAGEILALLALDERASFGLPALRLALDGYQSALDEELSALGRGALGEAAALAATNVAAAREQFARIRTATEAQLADAAADSGLAADVGTLSTLLSAAILVSLLFRRWERTRRRNAFLSGEQRGLASSEARFRGLVQHSSDLITVLRRDGRVSYASASAVRLLERPADDLVGVPFRDLVHNDDRARLEELMIGSSESVSGRTFEWRLKIGDDDRRRGGWRTFESVVSVVEPEHAGSEIILNSRDITERHDLESALRHKASHDSLTGLSNRPVLTEALERALARASRRGSHVGLLFLDFDDFKEINDALGHAAGDAVLIELAGRIRRVIRADGVVARFGGDEFAVLIEDLEGLEAAELVAARIHGALSRPIEVDGELRIIAASIGIVVSSGGAQSARDLMATADRMMYKAKAAGGNRHLIFDARNVGHSAA